MLKKPFSDSELILGLIGAVGTELKKVRDILEERLQNIGYTVVHIRITQDIIPNIVEPEPWDKNDEYARLVSLMNAGDQSRKQSEDNSILALGAAAFINSQRSKGNNHEDPNHKPRHAYIISSLKRPEEVEILRAIYPHGFYLIGVHADEQLRRNYLKEDKQIRNEKYINYLINRDQHGQSEHLSSRAPRAPTDQHDHGQNVADTFHLSDFFVRIDNHDDHLKNSLWRILALLFGHPYVTPTFDEHSMFMAFASSLHSADLSRQVGAVIARNNQVIASGTNDTPKAMGGQYWAAHDKLPGEIKFPEDGRDFALGHDSNKVEQYKIIDDILNYCKKDTTNPEILKEALQKSRIRDLTEFGRVVHAEMDALLSCARIGISVREGTLYSTTFPCHNCAKHIISAGISRVVYIEPYPKSKAAEFHGDSIEVGFDAISDSSHTSKVRFEPFVGVGPRVFFDLFSTQLGSGYNVARRNGEGKSLDWQPQEGKLRLQMLPVSYLELEVIASDMFNKKREKGVSNHVL